MSKISKETQDKLAIIAKKVSDQVKEILENGGDPVTDEKIQRMVKEQFELMKPEPNTNEELIDPPEPPARRKSGGFEDNFEDLDEDEKQDIKAVKSPYAGRRKIFASKKNLERMHRSEMVDKILQFQHLNDDLYIVGKLLACASDQSYIRTVRQTGLYQNMKDTLENDKDLQKALAASTSTYGAEWIPTGFSNQMVEIMRLNQKVEALFPAINMPTNPYTWPIQSSKATVYLIPEATQDENIKIKTTSPQTGNFTFTAKKFGARLLFSEELNEDSIVNVLDFTKMELGQAFADGRETAILNGCITTTQDAVTDPYDVRKAFDGLRYFALNNAGGLAKYGFGATAINTTKLRAVRKLALKYGVNPGNNAWIVSINGYIQMLGLNEVLTADKWPQGYTARFGELASFDGSPIVVSEHAADNQNASGVYDGSVYDRTSILYVYRPGFWIGNRTPMTLKVKLNEETDQIVLIGKTRLAFEDPQNALLAVNPQVIDGYNIQT